MTISDLALHHLLDGVGLSTIHGSQPSEQFRDRENLLAFVTQMRWRYPPDGTAAPEKLVQQSIAAINDVPGGRITPPVIRHHVTAQESALGLPSTDGRATGPAPVGVLETFLHKLEMRRGAYTYVDELGGLSPWINGRDPLAAPLDDDARINCWEAVLVAAVESGLRTVAAVKDLYQEKRPVETILARNGVAGTIHLAPNGAAANAVQRGQVIITYLGAKQPGNPLQHVVAVATAHASNIRDTEVYSLWTGMNGGVVRKLLLADILVPGNRYQIDYMSL